MTLSARNQRLALLLILLVGLLLRLKGIGDPIIDHPGWRQGDEAAIARNFAFVDHNILHPQADYNGPGPNYVELELQIVPYLASLGYQIFGVHEVFGRILSIIASLGTVAVLFSFGRWLFQLPLAGLGAAMLFAIAPGAVYYGRTFQPDTVMTFFLTCAVFVGARALTEDREREWRGAIGTTLLVLAAILAKSVAIIVLIPLAAVAVSRFGAAGALRRPQHWLIVIGSLVPYALYDRYERHIASWKWASGITTLHVLPDLGHALISPWAMLMKLTYASDALLMLAHTMLGPVIFTLMLFGFLTPLRNRAAALLPWWLIAAALYLFVVVTVERVDYYLYPFVPLAALSGGAYLGAAIGATDWSTGSSKMRNTAITTLLIALVLTVIEARREIAPYYDYNRHLIREARAVAALVPQDALVVMGHLDPSTLYYLHRRGWQEDPYLWTPFDEQSAIAKGARYYINVEPDRLARNVELAAWLKRFPLLDTPPGVWQVYVTDPDQTVPGAEAAWRAFRKREKAGKVHAPHAGRPHRAMHPAKPKVAPTAAAGSDESAGQSPSPAPTASEPAAAPEATAVPKTPPTPLAPLAPQTGELPARPAEAPAAPVHPRHAEATDTGSVAAPAVPATPKSTWRERHPATAHPAQDDSQLDDSTLEPGAAKLEHL